MKEFIKISQKKGSILSTYSTGIQDCQQKNQKGVFACPDIRKHFKDDIFEIRLKEDDKET